MITGLDHIVVLVEDIKAAVSAYQALLGRMPSWHDTSDGVERALFTLENMSLELLSASGSGPSADRIREVIETTGEGMASICFAVRDIDKMHRRLERVALKPEPVVEAESRDTSSGAVLHWKRTRAATDLTRGVRMFFVEPAEPRPRSAAAAPSPVLGLDHVVVATEDSDRAAALYGARLGLDMALDRTHQDWGQLMFFRCGDLVVEVVRRPGSSGDCLHDRLWGLSWRVEDIDGARMRLIEANIAVSEVRAGRKPGTRVMSVRSGTCGINTLFLQRTPRES